jgi:hypothetical protein
MPLLTVTFADMSSSLQLWLNKLRQEELEQEQRNKFPVPVPPQVQVAPPDRHEEFSIYNVDTKWVTGSGRWTVDPDEAQ